MATVIYKPADNRWGEIGSAFGKAFYEREQKKKAEEAEKQRREAYNAALGLAENAITNTDEDFNTGRVYKDLGAALDKAGATDQLDDMVEMVISARAQLEAERTKETYLKNLPKDSPAAQRMAGMSGKSDLDAIDKLSQVEKRLTPEKTKPEKVGDRKFTLYNPATGEEMPGFVPENIPHGQEQAYIQKTYGTGWTTAKPAPEDEDKSVGERKLTAVNSKGEKREVFVPKNVEPGQEDSFVQEKYGAEWKLSQGPEAPSKPNAKDIRDVEAELVRRGIDPSKAKATERAGARNVVNNSKDAVRLVAQNFGKDIVTDPLGNISDISFRGESDRIKYKYAAAKAPELLYDGKTPAEAAMQAERDAEKYYSTGEWLPPQVLSSSDPAVVEEYLSSKGITDPELVKYIDAKNFLENAMQPGRTITDIPLARDALARVLRVRNPELSEKQIQEEVNRTLGAP